MDGTASYRLAWLRSRVANTDADIADFCGLTPARFALLLASVATATPAETTLITGAIEIATPPGPEIPPRVLPPKPSAPMGATQGR